MPKRTFGRDLRGSLNHIQPSACRHVKLVEFLGAYSLIVPGDSATIMSPATAYPIALSSTPFGGANAGSLSLLDSFYQCPLPTN
jgi:hypothetical protein